MFSEKFKGNFSQFNDLVGVDKARSYCQNWKKRVHCCAFQRSSCFPLVEYQKRKWQFNNYLLCVSLNYSLFLCYALNENEIIWCIVFFLFSILENIRFVEFAFVHCCGLLGICANRFRRHWFGRKSFGSWSETLEENRNKNIQSIRINL